MDMTVQEYLEFAAELKKLPKEKRESDISEVMKLTRLQDVSDRLIKNLSKGYKQRVGLAQAILGFPEIIILDEPTVGLDPKQIIEIRELIRTLSKKHTVILSSHILAEVREVCDYILIISKGKLVASDTPENLELLRNGASSLELEVKAAPETARAILSTIDDIDAMEMHSENENLTRVKLETNNILCICRRKVPIIGNEDCKGKSGRHLYGTDTEGGIERCWQFIKENSSPISSLW